MTESKSQKGSLNHWVFWPPFLILLFGVVFNVLNPDQFGKSVEHVKNGIIQNFGWLFSLVAFSSFLICSWICFSKFGNVRIGGQNAKPLMSRWNWFSITICTTIAVGILLWSTAEPLAHFHRPPEATGFKPTSPDSARFALSTMFLHWTLTPYAIYAAASLAFAFAYYNMKKPYSLSAPLAPLLGKFSAPWLGNSINAVCLFALVAGMAATLGAGILVLASGLHEIFPAIDSESKWLWSAIAGLIILTFIISSASGLMQESESYHQSIQPL